MIKKVKREDELIEALLEKYGRSQEAILGTNGLFVQRQLKMVGDDN